jgi:predicted CopG family antitoxin
MQKRMTITLNEEVYNGLYRRVGKRKMSRFIEDLVRPHVVDSVLDAGYRAMAANEVREAEAREWCEALAGNTGNETW